MAAAVGIGHAVRRIGIALCRRLADLCDALVAAAQQAVVATLQLFKPDRCTVRSIDTAEVGVLLGACNQRERENKNDTHGDDFDLRPRELLVLSKLAEKNWGYMTEQAGKCEIAGGRPPC
ncbi:MAG: hypothetical protein H0U13_13320 [Gemmatimonadaceae bacterium]|nr:hypothetical protein [Gemmatimonadaceae bacterium]